MFINFSSSIQFMRPIGPSLREDKIKSIVTYLAIGILLGCAAFWIYTNFWTQRKVQVPPPEDQPNKSSPLFQHVHSPKIDSPIVQKKEEVVIEEMEILDDQELAQIPGPIDHQSPLMEKKELPEPPKEKLSDAVQPQPFVPLPPSETIVEPKEIIIEDEFPDADFAEGTADIAYDDSLSMEENIEKDLPRYIKQEKIKYSYGGLFYRFEGVYATLRDLQNRKKDDYVNFCNLPFADHFEQNKKFSSHWDLNISIDADQRSLAWKILSDELENTSLCIQGAIHSSEKCEPGKGIILQFLVSDHQKEKELRQFLTLLSHHLSQDSILTDSRPLIQEPLPGIIPCEGLPHYFSYSTDTFTVVEDSVWNDFLARQKLVEVIVPGKVVKIGGDPKSMIKASHYRTLGDARVNPFSIENPFSKMKILSLTH